MQIANYSFYEFFADGRVFSYRTNRFLKPVLDTYGYLRVSCIDDDGVRVSRGLHNWICRAFHGNPPSPNYEACHIDENKLNCCADNVFWDTHKNNINYGKRTELNKKSHYKGIDQYSIDGDFLYSYESIKEASEKTHISYTGILKAAKGKLNSSGGYIWHYKQY